MDSLILNVFAGVIANAVFGLLKKFTYRVIGKIQKRKNDDPPKAHRS